MQGDNVKKNRVKINIMGSDYTILSENDPEYVMNIANEVNRKISLAQASNPSISSNMATTLVCLDYCEELKKEKTASNNLRIKLNEYIKENTKLKEELVRVTQKLDNFGKAAFKDKNEDNKKKPVNANIRKKTRIRNLNTIVSDDDEVSNETDREEYLKIFEKNNL